jgi:hypothetical protein
MKKTIKEKILMSIIKSFSGTNREFKAWLKTWQAGSKKPIPSRSSNLVSLTVYRIRKKYLLK